MICKVCGNPGDFYPSNRSTCKECVKKAITASQELRRRHEREKYEGLLAADYIVRERLKRELEQEAEETLRRPDPRPDPGYEWVEPPSFSGLIDLFYKRQDLRRL